MEEENAGGYFLRKFSKRSKQPPKPVPRKKHRNSFLRGRFQPLKNLVIDSIENLKKSKKRKTEIVEEAVEVEIFTVEPKLLHFEEIHHESKVAEVVHIAIPTLLGHINENFCPKRILLASSPDFVQFFKDFEPTKPLFFKDSSLNLHERNESVKIIEKDFNESLKSIRETTQLINSIYCKKESIKSVPGLEIPDCLKLISDASKQKIDVGDLHLKENMKNIESRIFELENYRGAREIMCTPRFPHKNTKLVQLMKTLIECS
ncbi:hypothetical protein RF11_13782 [Thelohanellus kitauei]|uniref:Uncharacterized protein n=1 Tax=Thelohanellus kitauei TaxID=669202 RepID=A0A0C2IV88_THEKT|nr:hypothetical protein RF11_13782 [Thelohanellus kitauei]